MRRNIFLIIFIYSFSGLLWIYLSDWLVAQQSLIKNVEQFTYLQNIKGALFVILTAGILFILLKRSQNSYDKEHKKYTDLFQKNPNAICLYLRKSFKVIRFNQKFSQMFSVKTGISLLEIFSNDQIEDATVFLQRDDSTEVKRFQVLADHDQKLDCICSLIEIDNDYYLLIIDDITQELKYENELKLLNLKLEKQVEQRTSQLSTSLKELGDLNKELQVTNQRLAEANHRIKEQNQEIQGQGEEQLNRILTNLQNVAWTGEWPSGNTIFLSESAQHIYGVGDPNSLPKVHFWHPWIKEIDARPLKERIEELKENHYSEWSYRIETPQGNEKWLLDRLTLEYDQDGNLTRLNGLISDITPLKQAETKILEYNQRLDNFLNSITDGFFTMDQDWKITSVNHVFEKLVNRSREELIGVSLWSIFPEALSTKFFDEYSQAMKSGITARFQEFYAPLNKWFKCIAYTSSEGLTVFFQDYTHEKEIEEELLHAKLNLDSLINNTDDLIWSIDQNKNLISCNLPFHKRITAQSGTSIKTGDSVLNGNLSAEEARKWATLYNRALTGEKYTHIDYVQDHENTSVYEINFNPILNEHEQVIGVGCFAHDITSRRKHEHERSELINRLMAQNRNLEEFAFVTSHKIRAPIATILGLINLTRLATSTKDELELFLQKLEITAKNMDETIHDLSSILQIKENHAEVSKEFMLKNTLNEALQPFKNVINENKIMIEEDFSERNTTNSIPSYFQSIFYQLVSNSIKYRNPTQKSLIKIKSFLENDHWGISVEDNGVGIKEKDQPRLFELYQRFHHHTTGKGLGLFMVKLLVDNLNGTISVTSKEYEGTTIKIAFPNQQF